MKRFITVLMFVSICAVGLSAQETDEISVGSFSDAFSGFSEAAAQSLSFNSNIGLSWSDAYIGNLFAIPPHFGVGAAAGFTMVPAEGITALFDTMGLTLPAAVGDLVDKFAGVLIPAAMVEGRIGGIGLPFDLGLKVGMLPAGTEVLDLRVEYLNVGADVRFALVKENLILPDVSIGAGYNYLSGYVSVANPLGSFSMDIPVGNETRTLSFETGDVGFGWNSHVIDLKAQVSKSLLIFTPYLGAGVSYARSQAGGGFDAAVKVDGEAISDADVEELKTALKQQGIDVPELTADGLHAFFPAGGWGARVFGGVSLNIFVIKLDVTGQYNLTDGSIGGSIGLRLQL